MIEETTSHREIVATAQPKRRLTSALFKRARAVEPVPSDLAALTQLFGSAPASAWEKHSDQLLQQFQRHRISPGQDPDSLIALILAITKKRSRGRPKQLGITAPQWRDLLLYSYVEFERRRTTKKVGWVLNQIVRRPAFVSASATSQTLRSRCNRGKKAFESEYANASEALKNVKLHFIAQLLNTRDEHGRKRLDSFAVD